jgi:hypothetical protein
MSDPQRWRDSNDTPHEIRRLLDCASPTTVLPDAVRARSLARVIKTAAAPSSRWIVTIGRRPLTLVAVLLLSGAALAHQIGNRREFGNPSLAGAAPTLTAPTTSGAAGGSRPGPQPPPPQPVPTHAPPDERVPPATPAARTLPAAPIRAEARAPSSSQGNPSTPAATLATSTAPASDSLAEEAALLEDARRALVANPADALAKAELYSARFPRGVLADEGAFVAIRALLALGRREEAKGRGEELVARAPSGLYARRVRALFEQR